MNDNQREPEEDTPKPENKVWKAIKFTFKTLLIVLISTIIAVPLIRLVQLDSHPDAAKNFVWTEKARQSYTDSPDGFHVYEFEVSQNFSELGYFFFFFGRIAEDDAGNVEQIQLTVRYNDSTLEHYTEDTGLSLGAGEPFVYMLSDDQGRNYLPAATVTAEKSNLNYRRLVFEDVDMAGVDELTLNIYGASAFDEDLLETVKGGDESAFATMTVYRSSNEAPAYTLKKKELPQ